MVVSFRLGDPKLDWRLMQKRIISLKNIAGTLLGLLAAGAAILIVPKLGGVENDIVNLDVNKIRGVWFVPAGKTEDDIVWLDSSHIAPMYQMFSSEKIEKNPSKWQTVGRVGFTYENGRNAAVELYDTKSRWGCFKCGESYFRYEGNALEFIENDMQ
ncbi:MAG: hypothetical protein AAF623_04705 [Planctomycetota bacterium]